MKSVRRTRSSWIMHVNIQILNRTAIRIRKDRSYPKNAGIMFRASQNEWWKLSLPNVVNVRRRRIWEGCTIEVAWPHARCMKKQVCPNTMTFLKGVGSRHGTNDWHKYSSTILSCDPQRSARQKLNDSINWAAWRSSKMYPTDIRESE